MNGNSDFSCFQIAQTSLLESAPRVAKCHTAYRAQKDAAVHFNSYSLYSPFSAAHPMSMPLPEDAIGAVAYPLGPDEARIAGSMIAADEGSIT